MDTNGRFETVFNGKFDYTLDSSIYSTPIKYILNISEKDPTKSSLYAFYKFKYYDSIPEKHVIGKDWSTYSIYYLAGDRLFPLDSIFIKK
jgi:hypothetical protein